jgi:serine/threonine protein kinase/tetratricopeptide (TPR) repeat protein
MAEVWLGRHVESQTPIAVKIITTEHATDAWHIDRFRQEVQSLARLNHPGIVSVFEHGLISDEAAEQSGGALVAGSPFMVMQYAEGGTLDDQLPVQSWPEFRLLLSSILDALAYAHARDVIHRDLKPENVLCFPRDDGRIQVKLADFGIAQAMHPKDTSQASSSGASAGTPTYMAPEQSSGDWRIFGPWTDLYALGCMSYALVCGSPPFVSDSVLQLALDHMQAARPRLKPRFAVPDKLEWWIHKLMQPRSEDRFQRAAIAAQALDDVAVSRFSGAFEVPVIETRRVRPDGERDASIDDTTVDPGEPDDFDRTDPAPDESFRDTADTTYHHATTVLPDSSLNLPSIDDVDRLKERGIQRPDVPPDWRRNWEPPRPEIAGVGLGLFGLRDTPFVDRDRERHLIWRELRHAQTDEQSRVVILRGPDGAGKSRLAEWITQRAHELGAVDVMHATHDKHSGPSSGLPGMMRRFFRAWNIGRKTLHEYLQRVLERYFHWKEPDFGGVLDEDARALTELIKPAATDDARVLGPRYQFSTEEDRYALVQRVIDRAAAKHTTVCLLDDVQWGERTLDFVEFALEESPDTPVLYVLTYRPDDSNEFFDIRRRLELLEEHDTTTVIDIEPLGEEDHRRLVHALLPMTPELEERVIGNTVGQPVLAHQIIGAWVQEDLLVAGPLGFKPRENARMNVIADVQQIWLRRVREVLAHFDERERLDGLKALEIGAALGRAIDVDEWHIACGLREVRVPDGLVSHLVDVGLVERDGTSLTLVHELFRESLELSALEAGRWRMAKSSCADALLHLYPDRSREFARRRADYLLDAGRREDAVDRLLEAAHFAETRGFSTLTFELLDQRDEILDELEVADIDKSRVEGDAARLRSLMQTGQIDRSEELLQKVLPTAREAGWIDLYAFALRTKAALLRSQGRAAEALRTAEEGLELLEERETSVDRGWLEIAVGEVHWMRNEFAEARARYVAGKREFERANDEYAALKAETMIAFSHIYLREFDEARRIAKQTLTRARKIGDAWSEGEAWNQLGEIARMKGRFSDAHRHFQRLLKSMRRRDPRNRIVGEFNVVLVEVAMEHPNAESRLDWLRDQIEGSPERAYMPSIHFCFMGTAATRGDWEAWTRHFELATSRIEDNPEHLTDMAWIATIVEELTRKHAEDERFVDAIADEAARLRKLEGFEQYGESFYADMRG